jgi:cyclohexanecarboxyl-CoA dehydrogenase
VQHSVASIVFARAPGTERAKGISAFVVDHDQPGVTIGKFRDMGLQSSGRGVLALNEVFVPETHLLGQEGRGFALVMNDFDFSRPCIALRCLGAAQASLDEAATYMRDRRTFGKPLATRQGLTLPMAEHYTKVEACRLLCYRTLWLRQQGLPHTTEAAMCKWWGPKVARDAIETALLIHGHGGWSDEFPHQQRFRDVMAFFIGDGTAEIQKLIIARDRIGREVMD